MGALSEHLPDRALAGVSGLVWRALFEASVADERADVVIGAAQRVHRNGEPIAKEITMTFHRPLSIATAVVALGALSGAAAETNSEIARRLIDKQSAAVPACALLSDQEVAKMTGRPSYTKAEGVQLKNGGSSCTWDSGVNINLFTGPRSAEQHEDFLKAFKQDKAPRQTVSGLGDSAYATAWMGNQYQGNHAVLVVRKGPHTMGISLQAEGGETPQSVQPKLMTVAKAALAKLP